MSLSRNSSGSADTTRHNAKQQRSNINTRGMILSYPGWEQDKAMAEQEYAQSACNDANDSPRPGSLFYKKIDAMKNKQRLRDNDRSHPNSVAFDATVLTYDGWQADKEAAIKIHSGDCSVLSLGGFQQKLDVLKRKETIHQDRSSFDALRELDEHEFSYAGSESDLAVAERLFVDHPDSQLFHRKVSAMKIKQAVLVDGNRSQPDVVALDSAVFSYDGWQADKEDAMERILGDCSLFLLGDFSAKFQEMKRKEQIFQDRTRVDELLYLEQFTFTYRGWQDDKATAERLHLECSTSQANSTTSLFHKKVNCMKMKQKLFEGDRTDPDVIALDTHEFTYKGWQEDKQRALQRLTGACSLFLLGTFQDAFTEMKNKQEMHTNRHNLRGIRHLDSMVLYHLHDPNRKASDSAGDTDDMSSMSSCSSLEQEPDKTSSRKERNRCVVCCECEPTHAYIPCGHRCICVELQDASFRGDYCDDTLKCPICREPTVCVTRIFL